VNNRLNEHARSDFRITKISHSEMQNGKQMETVMALAFLSSTFFNKNVTEFEQKIKRVD
jgi:hypothetical protein